MSDFVHSKKTRTALFILGITALMLILFGLGIAVGYHRALFDSRFGENYYRNFYGAPTGGMMPAGPTHGTVGIVLDVATSTIIAEDPGNHETLIVILPATMIKEMNANIPLRMIHPGDRITVIGAPNDAGQIEAKFIRVFSASSTFPESGIAPDRLY